MDFYATLGVTRDASDEDIKKAYRKLVLEHHPDRNPGNAAADEKIREINAAYEILGNPEQRRTYERLRWGDEPRDMPPDPSVVLEAMERKLFDEARRELFAILMKNVSRVKSELAIIRERTLADLGYDSFKPAIVNRRAGEILHELVTPEMEMKKKRVLDVALQMMVSQKVVRRGDERGQTELRDRLHEAYQQGRLTGFASALEMFYERK
jgi:molecular chaperone DnaJ